MILDGEPEGGVAENSVGIYFAEQEAGFLAGIAAALETKTGKVGFIGGMIIPAVQKFGYGFVTGVAYANANLGTNKKIRPIDWCWSWQASLGFRYSKKIAGR